MYYLFLAQAKLIKFQKNSKGLGTVELVIILAVLVGLAIIFRKALTSLMQSIIDSLFGQGSEVNKSITDEVKVPTKVGK